MVGAVPAQGRMTPALTIGYRTALTRVETPFGPAGLTLRGHEFHRSVVDPPGDAMELTGRFGAGIGGYATPTVFASYLHQHIATTPSLAEAFVRAAQPVRTHLPGGPPTG